MDWLSHYMLGFLLGRRLSLDNDSMQALTLGALMLDMDIVKYLVPDSSLPVHGTLSHTLLGAIIFTIAASIVFLVMKKKFMGHWVAIGILMHLGLDMVNTISIYDSGKELLYPVRDTTYTLEPYFPYPVISWAIMAASIFAFSFTMFIKYAKEGDAPWRVWFDDRPIRKKIRESRQ